MNLPDVFSLLSQTSLYLKSNKIRFCLTKSLTKKRIQQLFCPSALKVGFFKLTKECMIRHNNVLCEKLCMPMELKALKALKTFLKLVFDMQMLTSIALKVDWSCHGSTPRFTCFCALQHLLCV